MSEARKEQPMDEPAADPAADPAARGHNKGQQGARGHGQTKADPGSESETGTETDQEGEPDARIQAIAAERDEMRDRWMRALADAENSRKRADRDRREAEQYGGSRLARDMLPVYDNLHRALAAATEESRTEAAALIEGVELTLRELLNVFGRHGITPISPEIGDEFNPQLHQAMFEAPVPQTRKGEIIQVMTQGFLLHDRLLRPAQVGVSSSPPA